MPSLSLQAGGWVALVGSRQPWANSLGIAAAELCTAPDLPGTRGPGRSELLCLCRSLTQHSYRRAAFAQHGLQNACVQLFDLLPIQSPA